MTLPRYAREGEGRCLASVLVALSLVGMPRPHPNHSLLRKGGRGAMFGFSDDYARLFRGFESLRRWSSAPRAR